MTPSLTGLLTVYGRVSHLVARPTGCCKTNKRASVLCNGKTVALFTITGTVSPPTFKRVTNKLMAPFIRLTALTKRFDEVVAVDNLSLDIEKGELFCLLGASGCGKSTLLRMLAGFEQPSAGRIEIDGQNMAGVAPADRPVNIMFQNYALVPHMSVAGNIGYGLRRAGMRGTKLGERIDALLNLVHLSGYGGRKPHLLSGGQRQRVALARALARQPKLLLLDEPLAALDKKLREDTQFELVDIQEKLGTTFMVVTHDQEEAMTLAGRIGIMDQGQLVQVDTPRTLMNLQNVFVADFLGMISFVEGRVTKAPKRAGDRQPAADHCGA